MTRTDPNPAMVWRRHDDDCIRSEDSTYWVSRTRSERWPGGYVYTAAWRPQDGRHDGVHLGCYRDAAEAKAACERHAAGQREAVA